MVDQLVNVGSHRRSDIDGMVTLLQRAAEDPNGPTMWPKQLSHGIDKDNCIYQFIKGDLRVPYFYDENKVVICTNAFLKQDNKSPKKQVNEAIRLRNSYFNAKAKEDLTWLSDEED